MISYRSIIPRGMIGKGKVALMIDLPFDALDIVRCSGEGGVDWGWWRGAIWGT